MICEKCPDLHNCRRQCMSIPNGKTCSDCKHVKRCTSIFGAKPEYTHCDFYPVRFEEATK